MDSGAGIIIGVQIAILVGVGIYGGWMSSKNAPVGEYNAKFWWNVGRTVVVFLPMALAWFGMFCGLFFQAFDLMIPVIVGVGSVGLNFGLDFGMSSGGFGAIWSAIVSFFLFIGRKFGIVQK
jgi:hypothetical protein